MLMPEAPIHKYDLASRPEDNVWPAGNVAREKTEPISHRVQQTWHRNLRLCMLLDDPAHNAAALELRDLVHDASCCLLLLRRSPVKMQSNCDTESSSHRRWHRIPYLPPLLLNSTRNREIIWKRL